MALQIQIKRDISQNVDMKLAWHNPWLDTRDASMDSIHYTMNLLERSEKKALVNELQLPFLFDYENAVLAYADFELGDGIPDMEKRFL